jgi:hypothetical protein
MSYKVNRALGHQKWGVTNPWVWANFGQPQRRRGYVSPMVFQTGEPQLRSAHLGQDPEPLHDARNRRMERYAIAGLTLSAASALMAFSYYSSLRKKNKLAANRRRRRSSRRRR